MASSEHLAELSNSFEKSVDPDPSVDPDVDSDPSVDAGAGALLDVLIHFDYTTLKNVLRSLLDKQKQQDNCFNELQKKHQEREKNVQKSQEENGKIINTLQQLQQKMLEIETKNQQQHHQVHEKIQELQKEVNNVRESAAGAGAGAAQMEQLVSKINQMHNEQEKSKQMQQRTDKDVTNILERLKKMNEHEKTVQSENNAAMHRNDSDTTQALVQAQAQVQATDRNEQPHKQDKDVQKALQSLKNDFNGLASEFNRRINEAADRLRSEFVASLNGGDVGDGHPIQTELLKSIQQRLSNIADESDRNKRALDENQKSVQNLSDNLDNLRLAIEAKEPTTNARIEQTNSLNNDSTENMNSQKNDSTENMKPQKNDSIENMKPQKNDSIENMKPQKNDSMEKVNSQKNDSTENMKPQKNDSIENMKLQKNDSTENMKPQKNSNTQQINLPSVKHQDIVSQSQSTLLQPDSSTASVAPTAIDVNEAASAAVDIGGIHDVVSTLRKEVMKINDSVSKQGEQLGTLSHLVACDNCLKAKPTIDCKQCESKFCASCDASIHQGKDRKLNTDFGAHVRVHIQQTNNIFHQAAPTVDKNSSNSNDSLAQLREWVQQHFDDIWRKESAKHHDIADLFTRVDGLRGRISGLENGDKARGDVISEIGSELKRVEGEFKERLRNSGFAARSYVDLKDGELANHMVEIEKALDRALKRELGRFETDLMHYLHDQQGSEQEAAAGRIHFRCISCDQLTNNLSGPATLLYKRNLAPEPRRPSAAHWQVAQSKETHILGNDDHFYKGREQPATTVLMPSDPTHNAQHVTSYIDSSRPPPASTQIAYIQHDFGASKASVRSTSPRPLSALSKTRPLSVRSTASTATRPSTSNAASLSLPSVLKSEV